MHTHLLPVPPPRRGVGDEITVDPDAADENLKRHDLVSPLRYVSHSWLRAWRGGMGRERVSILIVYTGSFVLYQGEKKMREPNQRQKIIFHPCVFRAPLFGVLLMNNPHALARDSLYHRD